MNINVVLVGCGKMGGAMLRGWLKQGLPAANVHVIEASPAYRESLEQELKVCTYTGPDELPANLSPDVIIFAVKPQMMAEVVPAYAAMAKADPVFLSVAAGTTRAFFFQHLGTDAKVVRCMPNTPAAVGRGITAACAPGLAADLQDMCTQLLSGVGEVVWLEDEQQMDAVTALSGSGPAYIFHMTEAMTAAGIAAGLPEDIAAKLAHATVCGAGELLYQADESPDQLRTNVTSPGGTTAAALAVLMDPDNGLSALMEKAVKAAAERSRELA